MIGTDKDARTVGKGKGECTWTEDEVPEALVEGGGARDGKGGQGRCRRRPRIMRAIYETSEGGLVDRGLVYSRPPADAHVETSQYSN